MIPMKPTIPRGINAIVIPAGNSEPTKVCLSPVKAEEMIPNTDRKRSPYKMTVMTGTITAIKLAAKPNFLPNSNDTSTLSTACYLMAI
jgi:hypothetical protein